MKNFLRKLTVEKVITRSIVLYLLRKRYSVYAASLLGPSLYDDFFKNKDNTIKEKFWAWKRGFLSYNIENYGLTESNFGNYLSDFDFYRLHPIDTDFTKWIDDKLTTKYILAPFKDYLPKYYYHIKKEGLILPLLDAASDNRVDAGTVLELLKTEGRLALKLVAGQSGRGFYKLSFADDSFHINDKVASNEEMLAFLGSLSNYLVTEYIVTHPDISRIYSPTPNTVRVMVINEDGNNPVVANAFMRFGTKSSGAVDNVSAGGVFAIVDVNDGRYFDARKKEGHRIVKCEIHPDSQVRIDGVLPHWDMIKKSLAEVSNYLSELTYLGFDIAMTETGFKILEINSYQYTLGYQFFYPLLVDNEAASFFRKSLAEKRAGLPAK